MREDTFTVPCVILDSISADLTVKYEFSEESILIYEIKLTGTDVDLTSKEEQLRDILEELIEENFNADFASSQDADAEDFGSGSGSGSGYGYSFGSGHGVYHAE